MNYTEFVGGVSDGVFGAAAMNLSSGTLHVQNGYGARFSDRDLHSRMSLVPTPAGLKLLQACYQWHSSRAFTPLTGWHCKFRPNTEDGSSGQKGKYASLVFSLL
jgi:hypothetical protein